MGSLNLETTKWSFFEKLVFRFFFILFVLLVLSYRNGTLPFMDSFYEIYLKPLNALVLWLGKFLLNGKEVTQPERTGSGDTTFQYFVLLAISIVTILGTIFWSVLDRHRSNYRKLLYLLTVLIRAYVGFMMISYGLMKLFNMQFGDISEYRLKSTYGESSPMGLAWTFFAYSMGYKYFMGFAELVGGLLLLFRRTSSLGAVITFTVTANIMAVNYFFDVPVKIISTILVVMSLFLILKDAKRFLNFFLLNKATEPANLGSFDGKKHPLLITGLKYALIIYLVFPIYKTYSSYRNQVSIFGNYHVESYSTNGAIYKGDSPKWKEINIKYDSVKVLLADNTSQKYLCNVDPVSKSIIIFSAGSNNREYEFNYQYTQPDVLVLNRIIQLGKELTEIKLRKTNTGLSPLMSRGFHWINEHPYNR
jgi:uncharacterized membrane protein YphA (DoxX/SURF4 family)